MIKNLGIIIYFGHMANSHNTDTLELRLPVSAPHKYGQISFLVQIHNILLFVLPDILQKILHIFKIAKSTINIKIGPISRFADQIRLADDVNNLGVVMLFRVIFFLVEKGDLIIPCWEVVSVSWHGSADCNRTMINLNMNHVS